jgi:hypothetical protein
MNALNTLAQNVDRAVVWYQVEPYAGRVASARYSLAKMFVNTLSEEDYRRHLDLMKNLLSGYGYRFCLDSETVLEINALNGGLPSDKVWGITIKSEDYPHTVAIRDDLTYSSQIETLAHELGHVLAFTKLPNFERYPKHIHEIIAEAFSYVFRTEVLHMPEPNMPAAVHYCAGYAGFGGRYLAPVWKMVQYLVDSVKADIHAGV